MVHLSVIVTAHNETLVCGPTMASADAAIACAQDAGFIVERIIALDNATPATTEWFHQSRFDHWTRITFTEGDLGRVRNTVVPLSKGKYIAFLDSDDLFSQTWLREGMRKLQDADDADEKVIVHPELNWLFDGAHAVFLKPDQTDPLFSPYHFYSMNYYDSLCMTPRAAHLEFPYVHRDIPGGLSFQDWHFSIETMAGGWTHVAAQNTIIFKRRRDDSLVTESRARRAIVRQIDAMAVDKIDDLALIESPRKKIDDPALIEPPRKKTGWPKIRSRINGLKTLLPSFHTPPAPPSETKDQPPHYGMAFARRVAHAKGCTGHVQKRDKAAYAAISDHFDHAFYLAQYPDIRALENVDPVAHYIRSCWTESRDPAPWFNTKAYLARHPELKDSRTNPLHHWLETKEQTGKVPPPVAEFDTLAESLGLSQQQAFDLWQTRYNDLRARLDFGELGAEAVHAATMEPLISLGWPSALNVKIPPFHTPQVNTRTAAMWRLVGASGRRRATHIICVNRARFGAAPRVEGHVARALAQTCDPEDVVVITTDDAGPMPKGKLPDGVRVIDFAKLAPDLKGDARQRTLVEFLRALHPTTVTNVNSRTLWDAMGPYGTALGATIRIYACLLCNEQNADGHWTGYPLRRFYRHFDQLSGVFTDSDFLTNELKNRYALPETDMHRLVTLPNPVDPALSVVEHVASPRPQIFWAGRLDAQKRVDLLFEIANAMPDVDFRVWGEAVMGNVCVPAEKPSNLTLEGTYSSFSSLPLSSADMWLYTSAWDGVPTMLLEVAMVGIPLVGSDVGGTKDVLRDELATSLPQTADVSDWVEAIRSTLNDPNARTKALSLRDVLATHRTPDAHKKILTNLMDLNS